MTKIEPLFSDTIKPSRSTRLIAKRRKLHRTNHRIWDSRTRWTYEEVEQQPHIRLVDWSAFELATEVQPDTLGICVHLAGREDVGGATCLSTRLSAFDPVTRRAVTQNGTVYELVGAPLPRGQATNAFRQWVEVHELGDFVSATREFALAMSAATSSRYTVTRSFSPGELPEAIGLLELTGHGALGGASYVGEAWSAEVVSLSVSDYPRGVEPLGYLLVRLLQQVPTHARVPRRLSEGVELAIYIGDTISPELKIEVLSIARDEDGPVLRFEGMYFKDHLRLEPEQVGPLDIICRDVPYMAQHWWDYGRLKSLAATAFEDANELETAANTTPWTYAPRTDPFGFGYLRKRDYDSSWWDINFPPHVAARFVDFFPANRCSGRKHGSPEEEWARFLRFNGVEQEDKSLAYGDSSA